MPQPPTEKKDTLSVDERASTSTESEEDLIESDPSFQHEPALLLINQERLNDLVRDLYLSKEKAEVLGSRLQRWNILELGTTISSFRSRNENLAHYYASAENICYCKDIAGLMTELDVNIILFTGGCSSTPAKQALKLCCCTMVISNHSAPWATVSSERNLSYSEDYSRSLGISQV